MSILCSTMIMLKDEELFHLWQADGSLSKRKNDADLPSMVLKEKRVEMIRFFILKYRQEILQAILHNCIYHYRKVFLNLNRLLIIVDHR